MFAYSNKREFWGTSRIRGAVQHGDL